MGLAFLDRLELADEASLPERLARDIADVLSARQMVPLAQGENVLSYGLPPLESITGRSLQDRERVARYIEGALRAFEPRLERVRTTPIEGEIDFRFQIEADLRHEKGSAAVRLEVLSPRLGAGPGAEAEVTRIDAPDGNGQPAR